MKPLTRLRPLSGRLTVLVAAAAFGMLVASCSPSSPAASNSSQRVITLSHISTLKSLFNKDNGHPRLVLIFSPT